MALNEEPDVVQLYWGYWLKAMACSTPSLGKECIFVSKKCRNYTSKFNKTRGEWNNRCKNEKYYRQQLEEQQQQHEATATKQRRQLH